MKKEIDLFNLAEETIDGDINHYKFTITGGYGTGKSTFANELFNRYGNCVTFGFEDRFKAIPGLKLVPIHSWEEAQSYLRQLRQGIKKTGKLPFDTVVIDPVGRMASMLETSVCEDNNIETIGDLGYGKGYSLQQDFFDEYEDSLKELGIHVNYVAHGKLETIKPPRDPEGYQVYVPDVPKKLIYKTQGEVDFCLFLDVIKDTDEETGVSVSKRRLYLQNYGDFKLKVPLKYLPDYIEYTEVKEGVDKFIKAFNNSIELMRKDQKNEDCKQEPIKVKQETKKPEQGSKLESDVDDISEIRKRAENVRDKLLNGHDKKEVVEILKKELGTAKISTCKDKDLLTDFIDAFTGNEE